MREAWLIEVLMLHGRMTLAELQANWERSAYNVGHCGLDRSTLHRHREWLHSMTGLKICCSPDYEYYISNPKVLEESKTSGSKLQLLRSTRSEAIIRSLANSESLSIECLAPAMLEKAARVMESIHQRTRLLFGYEPHDKVGEKPKDDYMRVYEPWCMKEYNGRIYMYGWSQTHHSIRTYSLECVTTPLVLTKEPCTVPVDETMVKRWTDLVGVTTTTAGVQKIEFHAYGKLASYLATQPYHPSLTMGDEQWDEMGERYVPCVMWTEVNMELVQRMMHDVMDLLVLRPASLNDMLLHYLDKYVLRNEKCRKRKVEDPFLPFWNEILAN